MSLVSTYDITTAFAFVNKLQNAVCLLVGTVDDRLYPQQNPTSKYLLT